MRQLPFFQPLTWTVSDLTRYLRDLLESDEQLQDLWVEGEVSNFSRSTAGHLYFTLKDAKTSLRCVMWRQMAIRQAYLPKDGQAIEVHGSLSVYEAGGSYQLYADLIRPVGEGALFQEFLRLKARLEAEGLFDPERKCPIPKLPKKIGIVTSASGAAIQDMIKTLRRRYRLAEVVLAPTPVQGVEAPAGIISALERLNQLVQPDVILVARGGGSIEDLWAFNDEGVARAIASSPAPVITGIGHETDFTIADFAADLRAPTPTAAAELATPNQEDLLGLLRAQEDGLKQRIDEILNNQRQAINFQVSMLKQRSPERRIRRERQQLDELSQYAKRSTLHLLRDKTTQLQGLNQRLEGLNPHAVLRRGYAIIEDLEGRIVSSVKQVTEKQELGVRVQDGQFEVAVNKVAKQR